MDDKIEHEVEEVNDVTEDDISIDHETFTYSANNNISSSKKSSGSGGSFIYIIVGVGVLIAIIIILVVVANSGKSSSYSEVESKMISGAKRYYKDNESLLPEHDGGFTKVDVSTLVSGEYIKPLSEYFKGVSDCTGYVEVYNVNDDYSYFPTLNCGTYSTKKLSDKIIDAGVVDSGSGLYHSNGEYVFRGEFPDNFVSFDGKKWRIIKINDDKSIKMILLDKDIDRGVWDDRYNSSNQSNSGINDFRVSRLLEYLSSAYSSNKFVSSKNSNLLVKKSWCIGKFTQEDVLISSIDSCSDQYDDLYIGLVTVHDVLGASLDSKCTHLYDGECTNYNYFTYVRSTWTLNASTDKSYKVFSMNGGNIYAKDANGDNYIRAVVNINSNVVVDKGTGTEKDPYVIGN